MAPAGKVYLDLKWGIDWDGPAGAAAEANELLALISPPSDTLHWLHCYYEPGERWQPVERLVVAEMIPMTILAGKDAFFRMMGERDGDSLFAELEGPNPRNAGFYDRVKGQFVTRDGMLPPSITQRQWLLWRSHRCYARVFWVIQGKHGGHKVNFSELERKILRMHGRPHESPYAGDLPFSPFNPVLLEKFLAMDRLQKWLETHSASWENRTAEDRARDKAQAEKEVESKILSWLDSQVTEVTTRDLGSNRIRRSA